MFVRWKRQTWKRTKIHYKTRQPFPDTVALRAYLCKSERVNGKPVHRTEAYLGGLMQDCLTYPHYRRSFWEKALQRLETVSLTPAQRERIIEQLAAIVKPVEAGEIAATNTDLLEAERVIARNLRR